MLTKDEVDNVLQAQDRSRRKKGTNKFVHCPFDFLGNAGACRLCHKWMKTNAYFLHPCFALDNDTTEIKKRFWRNPRRENNG